MLKVYIFLIISKAFDRAWHDGLIFKVKCIGINGMFLKLIRFLENRFPRVVLTGQTSLWEPVLAGVPQGLCFRASVLPYLHK